MSLDFSSLQQWIGRTQQSSDTLTPRLLEAYHATLAPNLADTGPDEAPAAIHWCLAPPAVITAHIGTDGHPLTGDFLPPIPLPRRMWAGGRVETLAPLRPGDHIVRESRIAAITHKEGRSGPLGFVTIEHELTTPRGVAIRERQDLVYREAAAAAPSSPAGAAQAVHATAPAEQCDRSWTIASSPVLLFRYSAMTFNSHRIHYDLPYATGTEGYSGLVVHGPLQASLLLNMAATFGKGIPRIFDYRGLAPLIAGADFFVCARREASGLLCWTQSAAGMKCMQATASW